MYNLTTNTPPEVYSETMTEIETTINEAIEGGWIPCRYIAEFTHDLKKGLLCDGEIAQALLDPKFWQAVWKTRGSLTILPSVEEVVSHLPMFPDAEILMEDQLIDYDKYKVGEIATLLTQDRNQAYTSLVEGIEGMKTDERKVATFGEWQAESYEDKMLVNAILTDIIEKVVKPLYGKE